MQQLGSKQHIIFFDGKCILCDGFVQYILKHDKKGVFAFCSLQSNDAKALLPSYIQYFEELNTVLLLSNNKVYQKSDVLVQVLKKLSGIFRFLGCAIGLVPKFIRDFFYTLVANNRYKWFGKKRVCGIEVNSKYKSRILS